MNERAADTISRRMIDARRAELGSRKYIRLTADDAAGLLASIDGLALFGESERLKTWAKRAALAFRESITEQNPGVKKTQALFLDNQGGDQGKG